VIKLELSCCEREGSVMAACSFIKVHNAGLPRTTAMYFSYCFLFVCFVALFVCYCCCCCFLFVCCYGEGGRFCLLLDVFVVVVVCVLLLLLFLVVVFDIYSHTKIDAFNFMLFSRFCFRVLFQTCGKRW